MSYLSDQCLLSSTGFIGSNLALVEPVLTSDTCHDHCQGNENCLSWTYDSLDQKCNLKSSAHLKIYSDMTQTSGYKNCAESYPDCYEENTDFYGNHHSHDVGSRNYDACKALCMQRPGCTHFSLKIYDYACLLKTSDSGRQTLQGWTSSTVNCTAKTSTFTNNTILVLKQHL